jgi:hypothetical protein
MWGSFSLRFYPKIDNPHCDAQDRPTNAPPAMPEFTETCDSFTDSAPDAASESSGVRSLTLNELP